MVSYKFTLKQFVHFVNVLILIVVDNGLVHAGHCPELY